MGAGLYKGVNSCMPAVRRWRAAIGTIAHPNVHQVEAKVEAKVEAEVVAHLVRLKCQSTPSPH
jgi:hypothetical protein